MVEWYSNPRFSGNELITIHKAGRISFNVNFVKKFNLRENKFCYLSAPENDRNFIKINFAFTKDTALMPDVNPFKLNLHPKSDRFQITPKSWFDQYHLKPENIEGEWVPIEKSDQRIGRYFQINVERK
ncbi:hypothetical protein GOV08_03810 [Candidatus Woesearchaeota archaeon]|nr:hypothetical protein [Candidatus Woesearchaeota archaeon]